MSDGSTTLRRVAMTGATGFVGYHTLLEMRHHGIEVVALVRTSSNTQRLMSEGAECVVASLEEVGDLATAMKGCDLVLHIAGAVGFFGDWKSYERVNLEGTRNVIAAARRAGVRRLVHTSSIVAVGASHDPTPLNETATWNLERYRVAYVTTKRQAEEAALDANGPDLEVVVANPGSVIGPDDFGGSEFGTLCRRFWRRQVPVCFGGGNNFVDVRDVASGLRLVSEKGRPGERYLLTGDNCTYLEFFRAMARVAGGWRPIVRLPNLLAPPLAMLNRCLDPWYSHRPYLSREQAVLMGLYFYYEAAKTQRELGYHARPLSESLTDAHAFWMGRRSDRVADAPSASA